MVGRQCRSDVTEEAAMVYTTDTLQIGGKPAREGDLATTVCPCGDMFGYEINGSIRSTVRLCLDRRRSDESVAAALLGSVQ